MEVATTAVTLPSAQQTNQSPRILLTTAMAPHTGGMSTHMLLLEKHLRKTGIAVECRFSDNTPRILWKKCVVGLLAIVACRRPRTEWLKRQPHRLGGVIADAVREKNANVIHAHDPIAAVAGVGNKLPIIVTVHGPTYEHGLEGNAPPSYLAVLKELEQKCFHNASTFICVDTGQKEILKKKGVSESLIRVIYNAVDVDALLETASARPAHVSGSYFVMARRLSPKNGPEIAIDAFLEWVGTKDVSLLVAGDGPLRKGIEKRLASHRNGRRVTLLGSCQHDLLAPLMKNAIASLVPSVPTEGVIEATSLSALESLALDVPVIASDIGGLSEIDNGSGVMSLVPPGDKGAIKDQFEDWHRKRSEDRGAHRSAYIRAHFGVRQWLDRHLRVYEEVLAKVRAS